MSRSGYSEDFDCDADSVNAMILYRTSVDNAIYGKRGQKFLKDLIIALDALSEKRLITESLIIPSWAETSAWIDPEYDYKHKSYFRREISKFERSNEIAGVCAIGSVGLLRGVDMTNLDPEHIYKVAATFKIAPVMAREIAHMNDEESDVNETPEQRWQRMRDWAVSLVK
jgi:hypothetical protein